MYLIRSDLVVKKLRYYARFIVVCLLLKKMKLVRELVRVIIQNTSKFYLMIVLTNLETHLILRSFQSMLMSTPVHMSQMINLSGLWF